VKSIASKTPDGGHHVRPAGAEDPRRQVQGRQITLEKGQRFVLDAACELGDSERSGLDYKELPRDVEPGAVLLLDDGKIVLEVTAVKGSRCARSCATAACSRTTRASTGRAAA